MKITLTQVEIEELIVQHLEGAYDLSKETHDVSVDMAVTRSQDGIISEVNAVKKTEDVVHSNRLDSMRRHFSKERDFTRVMLEFVEEPACSADSLSESKGAPEEATPKAEPEPEKPKDKPASTTATKKPAAKKVASKTSSKAKSEEPTDPEPKVAIKEERDLMQEALDECAAEEEAEQAGAPADEGDQATVDEEDTAPFKTESKEPAEKPRTKSLFGAKAESDTDGAEKAEEGDPEPKQAPRKSLFSNLQKP